MLARFHATQPGASLAFLLTLIGLLLLLQMGSMSFYRVMMTEMKWRKTLNYDPSYVLLPDEDFCAKHDYLVVYQTRVDDTEKRDFFRRTFTNHAEKADFLDTYRNLTFKVVVNLLEFEQLEVCLLFVQTFAHSHYVAENCTNVRVVLKIDDDIAWNVGLMFDYLSNIKLKENTLHCRTVETPLVDRNSSSKWYVSEEEYYHTYFPEYCLSPIYAATPYTITRLRDETDKAPHIWVDDVFSTGLVAREAGVSFRNLSVNVDWHDYTPFLKGTVVAQYLNSLDDMAALFQATGGNNSSSVYL